MNDRITLYINNVDRELIRLSKGTRREILAQIEGKITVELGKGRQTEEILSELGSPDIVAKSYLAEHICQSPPSIARFLAMLGFCAGTGFISLIVVPTLGSLIIAFGLSAIVVPLAGILKIMNIYGEYINIPTFGHEGTNWILLTTFGTGLILFLFAYLFIKLLGSYFRMIARGYRKLAPGSKSTTIE